jgi:hypothetical protein
METAETYHELNAELLDDIVEQLNVAGVRLERRKSTRQKFPVQQLVAPYNRKLPRADEFVPVSCHDLSTCGIAFYWPSEPDFAKAIVGLGNPPNVTYVRARVVRHARSKATGRVLVACEFIDRLRLS